jgi:hypothetical protein
VQPCAAALATRARRGFDDPLDRQIVRQRTSGRPWTWRALLFGHLWRSDLGLGFLFGLRPFEILNGKFELLNRKRLSATLLMLA